MNTAKSQVYTANTASESSTTSNFFKSQRKTSAVANQSTINQEQLRMLKESLNPFELRAAIEIKIAKAMRHAYLTGNINSEATNPKNALHG
ncbi:MAG: hypothetical protein WCI27_00815 [Candidatus Omnitrophota bacterium]